MTRWFAVSLLLPAHCLLVSAASAQSRTPVANARLAAMSSARADLPEVESLVRHALDNAPSLSALRARSRAAREEVEPAGALPDPMVGVMLQSMGPPWSPMAPMSMAQVEVSQTIPGLGKRAARRRAARAEAVSQSAEVAVLRARLAADVRSTYAVIYAVDAERQALEAGKELLVALSRTAAARYETGQAEQEALVKVVLEQIGLDEQLADLEAQRDQLVADLNQLAARPETTPLARVTSLPGTEVDLRHFSRTALERSPELRALRAKLEAASRQAQSAQTESRPNYQVGLAGGATITGDPMLTLRAGMELPIWSSTKQEPLARAAQKEAEAARYDVSAAELEVKRRIVRLSAAWRRDGAQVERYRKVTLPTAKLAFDSANAAYATGRADFSTVVEDFRRWLDAQIGLARREAARYTTWAELQALIDAGAPDAWGGSQS
jgi:outer membrane protein, heavy metal efflux system